MGQPPYLYLTVCQKAKWPNGFDFLPLKTEGHGFKPGLYGFMVKIN